MRTGIFLCLSPGLIVNSLPLLTPSARLFSPTARGSSERPFCAPNHPRFEHFSPSFPSKRPKFCPSLPAFYRKLSPFRRNKPAFCRKPAGLIAKAPRFLLSVSVRAPSRPTTLRRSSCFRRFPEARFPHFLRPQCQPPGVLRKYRTIRPRPHRFVPPLRQFCHLLSQPQ